MTALTSSGEISSSWTKRAPLLPRTASTLPSAASTVTFAWLLSRNSSAVSGSLGAM